MKRTAVLSVAAVAAALTLAACRSGGGDAEPVQEARPAPALERSVIVRDGGEAGIGRRVRLPEAATLDGKRVTMEGLLAGRRAVVVVMTSVGCPLSQLYGPRMAELEAAYADRGVRFVYVNTVDAESADEMRAQAQRFGFRGPYLPDTERAVIGELGAKTTTEVFVLDGAGTLVYRGAVDDQYGVGLVLDEPRRAFLKDAIDATLAGERPRVEATYAPGCLVDAGRVTEAATAQTPTYRGRVEHIMRTSCVECHRPAGAGPFSLVGIESVKGRAAMIEAVVRDGLMPPSHGAMVGKDMPPLARSPELPEAERADLVAWLRAGMPVGAGAAEPEAARSEGWAIGQPDMKVMLPRFDVPAQGPVRHDRLYTQMENPSDVWMTAMEIRTMRPEPVQRALVWLVGGADEAARLPAAGEAARGMQLLGVYSPGRGLVRYEPGSARRLPARALLMVDVYAKPMGVEMKGMVAIGVKFMGARRDGPGALDMNARLAEQPAEPARRVRSVMVASDVALAPGEGPVARGAGATLATAGRVVALTPVMGLRGRSLTVTAQLPDGSKLKLLDTRHFDGRWAIRYELTEPVDLPAGTRIEVRGVYDNSSANPGNPDARATVKSGAGPRDEVLMTVLEIESSGAESERE